MKLCSALVTWMCSACLALISLRDSHASPYETTYVNLDGRHSVWTSPTIRSLPDGSLSFGDFRWQYQPGIVDIRDQIIGNASVRIGGSSVHRYALASRGRVRSINNEQYFKNSILVAPAVQDVSSSFPLLSPFVPTSLGASWSDLPLVAAFVATAEAFPASTKNRLLDLGLLSTAIRSVFVGTYNQSVPYQNFLNADAHGPVYNGGALNVPLMQSLASSMTVSPPVAWLDVEEHSFRGRHSVDFDNRALGTEVIAQTMATWGAFWASVTDTRKYVVVNLRKSFDTNVPARSLTCDFKLLQGNPASTVITYLSADKCRARIDYRYDTTSAARTTVMGWVENDAGMKAAPVYVNVMRIPNEIRTIVNDKVTQIEYMSARWWWFSVANDPANPAFIDQSFDSQPKAYLFEQFEYDANGNWKGSYRRGESGPTTYVSRPIDIYNRPHTYTVCATGLPVTIPEGQGNFGSIQIPIPAGNEVVRDVNLKVKARHPIASEIVLKLTDPSGAKSITLADVQPSHIPFSDLDITFDDHAAWSMFEDDPPYHGSRKPTAALSSFNGSVAQGSWSIEFSDRNTNSNFGEIQEACLEIDTIPMGAGIIDGSFETPPVTDSNYMMSPGGSAWTFTGASGLSANASPYTAGNPNAPDGRQVLFLGDQGQSWQAINLTEGTYTLSFKAAQRGNYQATGPQSIRVGLGLTNLGIYTPSGTAYESFTTEPFTVAAGDHFLMLRATVPGDNSLFVDSVSLLRDGNPIPTNTPTPTPTRTPEGLPIGELHCINDSDPAALYGNGWNAFTGDTNYWRADHHWSVATGAGPATARFSSLPLGGYQVYATWTGSANRPSSATYESRIDGVTVASAVVNQQIDPNSAEFNGAKWKLLTDTIFVQPGQVLDVVLSQASNGNRIFDGVCLNRVVMPGPTNTPTPTATPTRTATPTNTATPTSPPTIPPTVTVTPTPVNGGETFCIADDGDSERFNAGAGWNNGPRDSRYFEQTHHFKLGTSGSNVATFTCEGMEPAVYNVAATWLEDPNRTDKAVFQVVDGSSVLATRRLNQRLAPSSFNADGVGWENIGTSLIVRGSTIKVILRGFAPNGYVIADAIRVERVADLPANLPPQINLSNAVIVDDRDAGFSAPGWNNGGSDPLYRYFGGHHYFVAPEQNNVGPATFKYDGAIPGKTYEVYSANIEWNNRSEDVRYDLLAANNVVATHVIDQTQPPGDLAHAGVHWRKIGNILATSNVISARIRSFGAGATIADAILFVQVPSQDSLSMGKDRNTKWEQLNKLVLNTNGKDGVLAFGNSRPLRRAPLGLTSDGKNPQPGELFINAQQISVPAQQEVMLAYTPKTNGNLRIKAKMKGIMPSTGALKLRVLSGGNNETIPITFDAAGQFEGELSREKAIARQPISFSLTSTSNDAGAHFKIKLEVAVVKGKN